jgi:ferredoxin-type protein NapH
MIPLPVRQKSRRQPIGPWPKIRFLTTLGFFILIGGWLWSGGSTCTVQIGGIAVSCPLGVVQVLAAARTILPGLLLAGMLGLLLVILSGRAFCGWICPGRFFLNQGPAKNSKPWKAKIWIQRAILGGIVGASYLCHVPAFCFICPAGVVCRGAIAAGTGGSILPAVGWLGALVGFEWSSGRSFCRDLCPLGTLFSWTSKLNPFIKPKADPNKCVPCKACSKVCPEGLNLSQDGVDTAVCTKCFACQLACPRDAVQIQLISADLEILPRNGSKE